MTAAQRLAHLFPPADAANIHARRRAIVAAVVDGAQSATRADPLANTQAEFPEEVEDRRQQRQGARRTRHELRRTAGRLLPGERVAKCGAKVLVGAVALKVGAAGACFSGLETCGSVWLCPVCAGKVAEGRRAEVARLLGSHHRAGGIHFMGLFTVPHARFDFAAPLRDKMALAWRWFQSGREWLAIKARFGVVGTIRAMEVTHGEKNGWHPHLHVLFLTRSLSEAEEAEFRRRLFWRWAAAVRRLGLGEIGFGGFGLHRNDDVAAAGDYVTKWGADSELTKWHLKRGGKGGRSPVDLLHLAADGDQRAAMLFREYAGAFKGKRQLTLSRGLRDLYLADEIELTDEQLAREAKGEVIGHFRPVVWARIVRHRVTADVLDAAEAGGWPAVLEFLRGRGLALGAGRIPIRCSGVDWRQHG